MTVNIIFFKICRLSLNNPTRFLKTRKKTRVHKKRKYILNFFIFLMLIYASFLQVYILQVQLYHYLDNQTLNKNMPKWQQQDSNPQPLVHKQILNHLAKLAKWLSCIVSTYLYDTSDCMLLSWCCHLNFRHRTCFYQWVPLRQATIECRFILKHVCDMIIKYLILEVLDF